WFEPFRNGLLLVLLANRLDVVRSLADWTESWLVPEARAIPIEPLLGKWIITLISDFRSSPLAGKEALEAELAKSRKRAPKLLFQAWQAVPGQNQKAFDKAFVTSVNHFDKGEGNKAECLDDLVGIHQS